MNTAQFTVPALVPEEPAETPGSLQLRSWHSSGVTLRFVYSRSRGGLIATGRAVIAAIDGHFLRLRSNDGNFLVTIVGATFSTEPQRFFSADLLHSHLVPGLSLQLATHDWLFLSASVPEGALEFEPACLNLPFE